MDDVTCHECGQAVCFCCGCCCNESCDMCCCPDVGGKLSKVYDWQVVDVLAPWGKLTRHVKVKRRDGKDGIPWDDLQNIKNEALGADTIAVEVYPAADRVVDELNMRHLWEVPQNHVPTLK